MRDIINTAIEAGSFKMFVSAVQAAGLVDTLRSIGPFTVFAPDDEAFNKLPQGAYDSLIKDVPKLKAILMYHVVAGKLTVDEIGQMNTAKTIQGQEVKIDAHKWHLHMNPKINDANITSKDIVADNGIIHVLNRVLTPNMELTCPVDGMGFMTVEALNAHAKMGHVVEEMPTPQPPAEVMPIVEKMPEPMPTTEVMPAVEKAPESMPVVEETPVVEKPAEPIFDTTAKEMPAVEKSPEPMPVVEVMPACGLDVHLAETDRENPAGGAAAATAGRPIILGVAAPAAEAAQVHAGVVKRDPSAAIRTLIDRAGDGASEVGASGIHGVEFGCSARLAIRDNHTRRQIPAARKSIRGHCGHPLDLTVVNGAV